MTYTNKGNALSNLNRDPEALVAHNEAIRINPHSAKSCSNKGYALAGLHTEHHSDAIEAYKKAICLGPKWSLAHSDPQLSSKHTLSGIHSSMGVMLSALGRHAEALVEHEEAIHLNPQFSQGLLQ